MGIIKWLKSQFELDEFAGISMKIRLGDTIEISNPDECGLRDITAKVIKIRWNTITVKGKQSGKISRFDPRNYSIYNITLAREEAQKNPPEWLKKARVTK